MKSLETPRLHLRPLTLADAPRMRQLSNHQAISAQTLTFPFPQPEGWAEERIQRGTDLAAKGEAYPWAICDRSGEIVGYISLGLEARHAKAELGYWIGETYWGKGYATEAASEVLSYALEVLKLNRVGATVFPHNLASVRVLEKLGMKKEGHLRAYVVKNNKPEDIIVFSIIPTDPS